MELTNKDLFTIFGKYGESAIVDLWLVKLNLMEDKRPTSEVELDLQEAYPHAVVKSLSRFDNEVAWKKNGVDGSDPIVLPDWLVKTAMYKNKKSAVVLYQGEIIEHKIEYEDEDREDIIKEVDAFIKLLETKTEPSIQFTSDQRKKVIASGVGILELEAEDQADRIEYINSMQKDIKRMEKEVEKHKSELLNDFKDKKAEKLYIRTSKGSASISMVITNRFDTSKFKAEHEAEYNKYVKPTESYRVTFSEAKK